MIMGRAGVRKVEQITEFGEKKLAVGAFGGAGGGPAGDERVGGLNRHNGVSLRSKVESLKSKIGVMTASLCGAMASQARH